MLFLSKIKNLDFLSLKGKLSHLLIEFSKALNFENLSNCIIFEDYIENNKKIYYLIKFLIVWLSS